MQFKFKVCSEVGKRRTNEDYFFPQSPKQKTNTFIVCDGIGGHGDGDKAAQFVCHKLAEKVGAKQASTSKEILALLNETNNELHDFGEQLGNARMGTTVAMATVLNNQAIVSWVGDSRVYHIRDGKILYQTKDHSMVELLKENGNKEVNRKKMGHIIYQAMGQNHQPFKPGIKHIKSAQKGDLFLLVTDGVFDVWDEAVLAEMLLADPKKALKKIAKPSKKNIKDNYTALMVELV